MITVKLENRTMILTRAALSTLEAYAEHMGHHYANIKHEPARRAMIKRDYNKIISKVLL